MVKSRGGDESAVATHGREGAAFIQWGPGRANFQLEVGHAHARAPEEKESGWEYMISAGYEVIDPLYIKLETTRFENQAPTVT